MNRVTPRLSRVSSAAAFTTGLAIIFAAAAIAGGPAYMKIGDIKGESTDSRHKGDIEIESWSWGASQAGGMGAGGSGTGKASIAASEAPAAAAPKVESFTVKQSAPAAQAKSNDRIRTAGPKNGWKADEAGEAEITLKGATAEERKRPGRVKYGDITLKRGVSEAAGGVQVAAGDIDGDGRPHSAAGPGSVRIKTKAAWRECRVGARYPILELSDSTSRYRLIDAVVTACQAASDVVPTDQISFNYAKIEF